MSKGLAKLGRRERGMGDRWTCSIRWFGGGRNEVSGPGPKQLLFRAIDRRSSVRLEPLGATIHLSENIWKAYSECSTVLRDDVYSVATRGISRNHLYGFAGSPMIRVDGSEWVEGRRRGRSTRVRTMTQLNAVHSNQVGGGAMNRPRHHSVRCSISRVIGPDK